VHIKSLHIIVSSSSSSSSSSLLKWARTVGKKVMGAALRQTSSIQLRRTDS